MTPVESRQLQDLVERLFGIDGESGALGRIEQLINSQDGRLAQLERERIAREAVAAAGERIDRERQARFRWEVTTFIALSGTLLVLFANVVMPFLIEVAR